MRQNLRVAIEFRLLGPLEAVVDGVPVPLGGPKQQLVLATLLLDAGRIVPVDRLVDVVWGADASESAIGTLQVYVSNLRRALGDAQVIETQRPGYLVSVGPDQLDLLAFDDAMERARAARRTGDLRGAGVSYREAMGRWRGRPLAGLPDLPFVAREAARLEAVRLAALAEQIDAGLAAGDHASLVGDLERLVAEHPFDEHLSGLLMVALYRSSRQADALAVFQRARLSLVEELGVEPGPQLRELEQRILEQDAALLVPDAEAPAAGAGQATVRRAPIAPTGFVVIDGERHPLTRSVTTIGRSEDRVIVLSDLDVSRCHAEIRRTADRHVLVDVGSTNGTCVNGLPVAHVELVSGDAILVGSTVLRYETATVGDPE